MVEGSQIDWAGHANNAKRELRCEDFERAVKVILDFAKADGNTLVVVTADHETGGMTLIDKRTKLSDNGLMYHYSTGGHSGVAIPVYLFGAGAEQINGVMENSDLAKALMCSNKF